MSQTICVAYGDGVGPEIMEATLKVLRHAGANLNVRSLDIGQKKYLEGFSNGIPQSAWSDIHESKIILKAPITTPQGDGYKSLNVTLRKALGLYANVRPCKSFSPFVKGLHSDMDMIIVRENEEDLYAGIEYQPTSNSVISYKLITYEGCQRIIRYAFELARSMGRKKVTCLVKDNIMKIADGLFHNVFKQIALEYQDIQSASMIVDIGSARIASRPKDFDVVVTLNLYGDIISDIAAEVSGSVGMAGSANIGAEYAMFEAIHGSAPDIAGQGIANPSGLINGAIMMLEHIGQAAVASDIKNALAVTIESGIHTADIFESGQSKKKVGTMEFADALIANLGKKPSILPISDASKSEKLDLSKEILSKKLDKRLIGYDVCVDLKGDSLSTHIKKFEDAHKDLKLHLVSQKGFKIWPSADCEYICDLVTLRYFGFEGTGLSQDMLMQLIAYFSNHGYDINIINSLYTYDGKIGFTLAQGE